MKTIEKAKAQRGRPPARSRAQVLLERDFLAYFAARGIPTIRTATAFFGWIARKVERAEDSNERRERLIRDFTAAIPEGRRTWENAIGWYCTAKGGE